MINLKQLRTNKKVSQKEVADYIGVSRTAYNQYESGKRDMSTDTLIKLADYFNVSIDAILGRSEEETPEPSFRPIVQKPVLYPEDETMLPVVASLRCGFNAAGEPFFITKKIPIPNTYIRRWGKEIVGVEAVGESMLPTIRPGDICIVVPGEWWENGQIVVADINDSDTIKRIRRAKDGGIDLIPDNKQFEPMHISPKDLQIYQVHILGRVVKTIPPDL